MWTNEYAARQRDLECRYQTALTNAEWEQIQPLLPRPAKCGRKLKVGLREMLNATPYMARSGGGCRMLPVRSGPWKAIYWWFRRLTRRVLFRTIHDIVLMLDGEQAGREASLTAGVVDSQTVKALHARVAAGMTRARCQAASKWL